MPVQYNSLKIIQLNCQGLCSPDKQLELKLFIEKYDPDIMLLSETHLKPKHKLTLPSFYIIYRTDRIDRFHGGTAIIIKTIIKHELLTSPKTESFPDTTAIKVHCNVRPYIFTSIYSTEKVLGRDLTKLFAMGGKVFIGGDFNARHYNWYCASNNQSGKSLSKFIDENSNIGIHFPDAYTCYPDIRNNRPSVIDLSLTKNINIIDKAIVIDDFHSDHRAVLHIVPMNSSYKINTPAIKLNFGKANWELFRHNIDQNIVHNVIINSKEDIDKYLHHLMTIINNGIEIAVPKCSLKKSIFALPTQITDIIRRRNILRRKCRNSGNPIIIKQQINMLTRYIRASLNKIKNSEFVNKLEAIPPNSHRLFQPINKLYRLDKARRPLPPFATETGYIHNIKEKANMIAKYFESISSTPAVDNSAHDLHVQEEVSKYFNTHHNPQLRTPQVTPKELKGLIKDLKSKKAPGNDKLNNITIKNLSNKALILLAKITNAILKIGYFPSIWKIAKIIPIPKPGKIPNCPQNLRPISLLSALSKLVEKIILNNLRQHLDDNHIIQNEQFGFRISHSATQALTRIVEKIVIGFNRKETTVGIFMDIEKAFDKVWHTGLLYKLIKIDTPHYIISLVQNYLSNRSFNVNIDDTVSDTHFLNAGVPQGSLLGPILYIIYTYDLPTTNRTFSSVYADDNAIFCTSLSAKLACSRLQTHIDLLSEFNCKWKLKVNSSKSESMVFSTRRYSASRRNSEQIIKYNNEEIKFSKSVKYLGLHLVRKLNFSNHTKERVRLAQKAIGLLYPALKVNSGLNSTNKIRLYSSYIRPILTYAAPAWMTMSESNKNSLQIIQNNCLRMAINFKLDLYNPRYISNVTLHKKN